MRTNKKTLRKPKLITIEVQELGRITDNYQDARQKLTIWKNWKGITLRTERSEWKVIEL